MANYIQTAEELMTWANVHRAECQKERMSIRVFRRELQEEVESLQAKLDSMRIVAALLAGASSTVGGLIGAFLGSG